MSRSYGVFEGQQKSEKASRITEKRFSAAAVPQNRSQMAVKLRGIAKFSEVEHILDAVRAREL